MSELYSASLRPDALAIFLFHGVIPSQCHPVRNYTVKHLEVDRFKAVLDDLSQHGSPLSMPEVVQLSRAGQPWPAKAFALTFDDGFANNYNLAAPLLETMKLPACFYVTTQFIGSNNCSWIDRIEYAVENQAARKQVSLPVLGIEAVISTPADKIEFLDVVRKSVKANRAVDPYEVANAVWGQLAPGEMVSDEHLDRKMSWAQVRDLEEHPLFTVGGHGHTHRILSYLSPAMLEEEISESMRVLRGHLKQPVKHYSYPEGLTYCYSPAVISELKKQGILCCPSAEPGVNSPRDDLFHLKRIMVI